MTTPIALEQARVGEDVVERDDHELAACLARTAGRVLLAAREADFFRGRELGTLGDALSQDVLARSLGFARSEDAILSEEAAADESRLSARRVWVVDPLDGTREYGEGRGDWAVHVALVVDGRPGASAVALPALGTVFSTVDVSGAVASRSNARRPLRVAVSRSRPPAEADQLVSRLGAQLVPMGSAGYKAMAVVCGEVDAYVHAGGQYEWDSAAPVGVALAAGLHASRIDGSELVYNRPDPLLPDLLVSHPSVAAQILGALGHTAPTAGGR